LELFDPTILGRFAVLLSCRTLEGLVGLIEYLFDPIVNLTRLHAKLVGEIGDRLLPAKMSSNRRGLLVRRKVPAFAGHGMFLPWPLC
jgi:hypothetical protein